jgi:hypothetical protein
MKYVIDETEYDFEDLTHFRIDSGQSQIQVAGGDLVLTMCGTVTLQDIEVELNEEELLESMDSYDILAWVAQSHDIEDVVEEFGYYEQESFIKAAAKKEGLVLVDDIPIDDLIEELVGRWDFDMAQILEAYVKVRISRAEAERLWESEHPSES